MVPICHMNPELCHIKNRNCEAEQVFELMECELFHHLNDVVRIDEKSSKQIMRKVLNAVHFLHKNDIIHRDIKLVGTWKTSLFFNVF